MIKKYVVTLIMLGFILVVSSAAYAGGLVRAGTVDWQPYYAESLKNGGFITEITREAYKRVGWEYQVEFMNWNRAMGLCRQGQLDMVQAAYYTEERAKDYIYSKAYASVDVVFFKKKGSDISYTKMEDLKDVQIGLNRGYGYPKAITEATYLNIQFAEKEIANIRKLLINRVDLIVGSRRVIIDAANRELPDQADQLVPLEPVIQASKLYNIASRNIPNGREIIAAFNRGLGIIIADGTYEKILRKHGF